MAEARLAVAPVAAVGLHNYHVDPAAHTIQVAVTRDGFLLYVPHINFIVRNIIRFLHRTHNALRTALWPASLRHVILLNGMVVLYIVRHNASDISDWEKLKYVGFLLKLDPFIKVTENLPDNLKSYWRASGLAVNVTTQSVLGLMVLYRYLLRATLHYTGWLSDPMGKPGLKTKLWAAALKYVFMRQRNPLLYTYQYGLPRLPVPKLEQTISKYLDTIEPLVTSEEWAQIKKQVESFKRREGPKLQRYLVLKSWVTDNYVSDWWLNLVYLRGRSSLMINSNYYGMGYYDEINIPTTNQVARAASLICQFCKVKQMLDWEKLNPLLIRGIVPLCMAQYQNVFSLTRIPGKDMDTLKKYDISESKHIVVLYKGQWYRVNMYTTDGKLLTMYQVQAVLQGIVDYSKSKPRGSRWTGAVPLPKDEQAPTENGQYIQNSQGLYLPNPATATPEHCLAALTAENRTEWANVRERHFHYGVNRDSLDIIERAMFVVHLDDAAPTDLSTQAQLLFHGNGATRWCDKSFNLVVFANGRSGIHAEHSWADAPALAHCWEMSMGYELQQKEYSFDENGFIRPRSEGEGEIGKMVRNESIHELDRTVQSPSALSPHTPSSTSHKRPPPGSSLTKVTPARRLLWQMNPDLEHSIQKALEASTNAIHDIDLVVRCHEAYGKGLIKKMGVGPDGFVQMALQIAYFRDQGKFPLTYESSMLRLFKNGRTETIRSVSKQSCAFVKAFLDSNVSKEEKVKLLKAAVDQHQLYSREAMAGKGVDRHLFALYVVSVGTKVDSPFLKSVLSQPWSLSTSQVPQRQTPPNFWPGDDQGDKYTSPSGGFGPVADDGYGVSYAIVGDKRLFFHVSSKRSAKNTNSTSLQDHIFRALAELKDLFPPEQLISKPKPKK